MHKAVRSLHRFSGGLYVFLFFLSPAISAQEHADTLQEVTIKRDKNGNNLNDIRLKDFSSGQKVTTIDSSLLQQYKMLSASQLLAQQTPVFIRSYGFNGLATLNFRGSSSAQSQVYWNGIPISNASLGIADISLLPVAFISHLNIVYGGSAALLGSGNVGGALMIGSEYPRFDNLPKINYEIGMGAGSYHQYQATAKLGFWNKKWFASGHVIWQAAQNDFHYDVNNIKGVNNNAELKGISTMAQVGYKVNDKNMLCAIGWYQKYDRNIPAALFESSSVKNRKDASLKMMASWEHKSSSVEQYVRASFLTDDMMYVDTASKQNADNASYQYYIEAGWKQELSARHKLLVFVPVHISQMKLDTSIATQSKYALAGAYSYQDLSDKLQVSVNVRGERINTTSVFLPGINASYKAADWIKLRANIQKTYRMPSLNELYFEPGGNKNLKPERGWAQDAGYAISFQPFKNFSVQHDLAVYHRLIDDWIVWYGGAIWTPHNIATVRSRGVELEYLFKYAIKSLFIHLGLKGNYTRATTVSSYLSGDGSIGKQIPYTPEFTGLINIGVTFKTYYFNYNHTYTGLRYFNTDETGLLRDYYTANIQCGRDFGFKKYLLQVGLQLNNISNVHYTVVASRPMPGRNLSASVILRKK